MGRAVVEAERWYLMAPRSVAALGLSWTVLVVGLGWFCVLLTSVGDKCRANPSCSVQLSAGWLPLGGGRIDLTDHQWDATRRNLPIIAGVLALLAAGTWVVRESCVARAEGDDQAAGSKSSPAPRPLVVWYAAFGVVFVAVLSGLDALILLFVTVVTFALSRLPASATIGSACAGAAGCLPSSVCRLPVGPTVGIAHLLAWMTFLGVGRPRGWTMDVGTMSGGALAPLRAITPSMYPWTQLYNLLMLRLVSFLLDSHWAQLPRGKDDPGVTARAGHAAVHPAASQRSAARRFSPPLADEAPRRSGSDGPASPLDTVAAARAAEVNGHPLPPLLAVSRATGVCPAGIDVWTEARVAAELKDGIDARTKRPRPADDYVLLPLLAYAFYPPLLLAGPVLSFNAFASQLAAPRRAAVAWGPVLWYSCRWIVVLVLLEAWLHAWPLYAVSASVVIPPGCDAAGAPGGPCAGTSMLESLGLGETLAVWEATVVMLWIKFVVLWRLFRALALLDGIDCEENQASCVWMTSSIGGFWKGWHRSFNRWIVRYIYAPIGGGRGSLQLRGLASGLSFVFVALWHDFSMQLLVWGLAFAVLTYPEMQASALIHSAKTKWAAEARRAWWYPLLGGSLGVAAGYVLLIGNLIGFGPGLAGLASFARRSASWGGLLAWSVFTAWHLCLILVSSAVRAARGYDVARPPLS